jgi:hypothetical protein
VGTASSSRSHSSCVESTDQAHKTVWFPRSTLLQSRARGLRFITGCDGTWAQDDRELGAAGADGEGDPETCPGYSAPVCHLL